MLKSEGFRLFAVLLAVVMGAVALFYTFHSMAATPDEQSAQSAIILKTPQSGQSEGKPAADSPVSGARVPAPSVLAPVVNESPAVEPAPTMQAPSVAPSAPAAPSPAFTTIPVTPAPPIDLDDDHDDPHDNHDDHDDHDGPDQDGD